MNEDTPQQRHAMNIVLRDIIESWLAEDGEPVDLLQKMNGEAARAARIARVQEDCA